MDRVAGSYRGQMWVRKHPYLALAIGYLLVFAFTTCVWLIVGSNDLADSLSKAFMSTLIYVLLALFQIKNLRKTQKRLDEAGQFRTFIRNPDSLPGSLSGIWNQGIATPAPGSLRFQPAVYDNLELSGRSTELNVVEVLPERRKVTGKDRKYMPAHGFRAITLMTETNKIELAASPESLDKLIEIAGPGSIQAPRMGG
ncbi:hypothetical protein MOD31_04650 [Paenarthrobacter sp. TYUT067]|uniref:hypothetical protein n=1 Tax=Paenarthrobacter sp. TYUT067 TaxID=2926245 RepID=UPI00202DEF89|nr:hypothetical protein [Paenarthrobacter sp. TYUT067]MCM0615301.1 hypothetical protein [Paenarthrobacter sp. TYUT067]